MLFLLFQLGKDRYALAASQIEEILPLVSIRQVPGSSAGVIGVFNYHGTSVPVVDLSELILGQAAPSRLSTRIVIARYDNENGKTHLLGIIVENATETMQGEDADFIPSGISNDFLPFLGAISTSPRGLIQRIDVHKVLSTAMQVPLLKRQAKSRQ
ncbi:MAG: chemotaxis protein CheW [Pseudomonadota bacterium]